MTHDPSADSAAVDDARTDDARTGDATTDNENDAPLDDEAFAAAAEELSADLATIAAQRDEYLAVAQRVQAEFENFKKQTIRRNTDLVEQAAAQLVGKLLPVLDAFDGALAHDDAKQHVRPIYDALMDILEKDGLTLVVPMGEPFDPNRHEAVMHEAADEGEEPTVSAVLRAGYEWKGRVLRPAMVKVKG